MDMEFNDLSSESKNTENIPLKTRVKTSNRMNYEAQVDVIRKQIGDLEAIRGKLNLSQRKMAQLLLVDPSAWSRWTTPGESAPPHIYRALQWYMTLQEQVPGLNAAYFLQKDTNGLKMEIQNYTDLKLNDLEDMVKKSHQEQLDYLQNMIVEMKERTDHIVHQSSKDILKLEDEVAVLKAEAIKSEREIKMNLESSKKIKSRVYLLIGLVIALMVALVLK